jgi:ABC-2 type transport system ATP-binding protein
MICIENLTKTFDGFTALDRLNLRVAKGSVYGLAGVNGAGKTTALKHLAGVYRQDAGQVRIDGAPVYDNRPLKARLGFIPEDLYFFPGYTIGGLRKFYRRLYPRWDEARFKALLALFGLDPSRRLNKLSRGMQKQAAFAVTLALTPDVLLLDEPIDGLDPIVRRQVVGQVLEDVADRGLTVLMSSHNLKEMEGVCDAVGIMKNGRMVLERDLDELKTDLHKVQVAFPPDVISNPGPALNLLRRERRGSVELWIVRGRAEEVERQIRAMGPLLYDLLPLTLEEIFIYELQEAGDLGKSGGDHHEILH